MPPSPQPEPAPLVVGVDTGGTFTDFAVARGGRLEMHKELSTPADPSLAFLAGAEALGLEATALYLHGTTVATNALLQRRGARTAFLATAGFRDLLHLARQTRLRLYDLHPERPEPLVPRALCFEAGGRIAPDGSELEPLDEEAVRAAAEAAARAGAESLAICFLFSFACSRHEERAAALAAAHGLAVSTSSRILPEYREYERASTTAANACVAPLMERYLGRLEERLAQRGHRALRVMQSSGGVLPVAVARREPVRTVLSGPAGGVIGAWRLADLAGFPRALTLDMGGTSTDVALCDGEPQPGTEGEIGGLPVRVPMLEIHTVGAGGGSLLRVDSGGTLRVGPESAGADPGPAAFGRGTRPTVTDAAATLGLLPPEHFLGGRLRLDVERSRQALAPVATELRLSVEQLAHGALRVADVQMARALRRVSVERGQDPRDCCLVAFGGGGPLHACSLATETGVPVVLVPRYPGLLSALGLLLCDLRRDFARTVMLPLPRGGPVPAALVEAFAALESTALEQCVAEGFPRHLLRLERRVDARYRGQSYELGLPATDLRPGALCEALHAAHQRRFGLALPDAACEVVTARVAAICPTTPPELPRGVIAARGEPAPLDRRALHLGTGPEGGWQDCSLYARRALQPGHSLRGPALVVQEDSTTWIPPGWCARVDEWYNLLIRAGVAAPGE